MKKEKSATFKKLIDHIDETWFKLKGFHYPFTGKDFSILKKFSGSFQDWGMAALWNSFLRSENEWVKKSGYSLDAFFRCLPWLVDTDWKAEARAFESKWVEVKPDDVLELFKVADTLKGNFTNITKQIRSEGYRREGLVN